MISELIDSSEHKIILLEGAAGTGKTYQTAKGIVDSSINIESVLLAAPSHTAKDNLFFNVFQHSGQKYDSCTVSSLLCKLPYIDYVRCRNVFGTAKDSKNDLSMYRLLVVDEVFMIELKDILGLIDLVNDHPGLTLLMMGDRKQLPPVSGKSPASFFDKTDYIKKVNLTKVYRQSGDLLKACEIVKEGVGSLSSLGRIKRKMKKLESVTVVDLDNYKNLESPSIVDVSRDMFPDDNYTIISYTNNQVINNNAEIFGCGGKFLKGQEIILYGACYDIEGFTDILDYWGYWKELGRTGSFAKNSERLKIVSISEQLKTTISSQFFSDLVEFYDMDFYYQNAVVENSSGARAGTILLDYTRPYPVAELVDKCIKELSKQLKNHVIHKNSYDYKYLNRLNSKMLGFLSNGSRPSKSITCHKSQGQTIENVIVDLTRLPNMDLDNYLYTAVTRASKTLTLVGY